MKSVKYFNLVLAASIAIGMASCDKTELYDNTIPPPQVHFTNDALRSYPVRGTGTIDPYTIEIGTTDVTNSDRTVTYEVSSPTGAALGTQYSLPGGGTVVIPAGSSTATFDIQGILAGYPAGRIDTLVVTLSEPSVKVAGFQNVVKIAMGDICSEENAFNLDDFLGNYDNTNETLGSSPYGPYTTSISSATSTSATSAVIVVQNIFDDGWGPISFNLDWSDPLNKTVTTIAQNAVEGSDAGSLNSAYAGMNIAVRQPTGSQYLGTFSSCDQTFVLKMQLGVYDPTSGTLLGYFGVPANLYTVTMAR
jgi:hypothetical protein